MVPLCLAQAGMPHSRDQSMLSSHANTHKHTHTCGHCPHRVGHFVFTSAQSAPSHLRLSRHARDEGSALECAQCQANLGMPTIHSHALCARREMSKHVQKKSSARTLAGQELRNRSWQRLLLKKGVVAARQLQRARPPPRPTTCTHASHAASHKRSHSVRSKRFL
jgi:hypothetical protein